MQRRKRSAGTRSTASIETPSYPDGSPANILEREIAKLNKQSYPADDFARIDDLLVWAICGSKRRRHSKAWNPQPAFHSSQPASTVMTAEDATLIANMFEVAKSSDNPLVNGITQMAKDLTMQFPKHFSPNDISVTVHLLTRYYFLLSDDSPISIQKVQFGDGMVVGGLKATKVIPGSTPILVTCSSMSSDCIGDVGAISAIQPSPGHLGPSGIRLVLGPFRFANHDCRPNGQFRPISGTSAVVIWSLMEIDQGTPLTVAYASDKSYFGQGPCLCSTCTGNSTDLPRKPDGVPEKKKMRRGGKKARLMRAKQMDLPCK